MEKKKDSFIYGQASFFFLVCLETTPAYELQSNNNSKDEAK
jgi:hypothetical protein